MTERPERDHAAPAAEDASSEEQAELRRVDQRDPVIMDWVLSKKLDLDVAFGLEHAEYAGPPYTQLSPTTSTLRLLMLMPGDFNDDISGFLIEVPIASKPKYVALYTYGAIQETLCRSSYSDRNF
jgi:hypothetical protein